jgi:predicted transcriptional regulator
MARNMQMPEEFFIDVYNLLSALDEIPVNDKIIGICNRLEAQLKKKAAAMERREIFTAYKTAPEGSESREIKRKEYLDQSGVHPDWRSATEIHP